MSGRWSAISGTAADRPFLGSHFQTSRGSATVDGYVCVDGEEDLIPIDVCRQILGDEAAGLSDEEVDRVRRHANALAHILVELAQEAELGE